MVISDSDYEGDAIESLASLFKVTQVFLWHDVPQVSLPPPLRFKSIEADGNDNDDNSDHVPDWTDILEPEDVELNKHMSELGLPISFNTTKEKRGPVKSKRKGTRSKQRRTCHNAVDEVRYEASVQELLSPGDLHDKTNSSLSCISMLGQSECSYYDGAEEVEMAHYASGEVDDSACCTGIANDVSKEKDNDDLDEANTNDAQVGDSLISSICAGFEITPSSDTIVSAASHVTDAGVNYCAMKHDESLIDSERLDIAPIVSKETECETVCNNDGTVTWQLQADDSELVPTSMEGIGCDQIDLSNNCGEFGDWMVFWDDFYMRNYFYNSKTHTSIWEPPPGMEHQAIGGPIESDLEATTAAEECGTQNDTKASEKALSEEELQRKQHDEYSVRIGVAAGDLVTSIITHHEDQPVDHSDEYLERSSCNGGVSCCSISNTLHVISSNKSSVQAASDVIHNHLENMVIDMPELDTEFDPSMLKKEKKVKRRQRDRKKSYSETEALQSEEMPEEYAAIIGKYWYQRYILFSRFDDGVKLDEEGWFSVTPEPIARYQAERCASDIIIDCFVGVGGNAIQFAKRCRHVIAIDIDPLKINYARHNAAIYGVDDQIDFIMGDFFLLGPKLKADTVFLSPPWGGPDYAKVTTYDMKTMLRPHDGYTLFNVANKIASRVVMFLPRNVNFNQLADLALSTSPPWSLEVEKVYLNRKLKAITAYFSDPVVFGGDCRANKHTYFDDSD